MAYIGTSPTNITNVADDLIDEANLKVSNTPINGYFLSAQSGNTGGLTWATAPAGYANSDVDAHLLTSGVTLDATNDRVGIGTNAPLRQLHISNTSANSEIAFTAGTSGTSSILFGDGLTGTDVYKGYVQYQHNGDYMLLAANGYERFRVDQYGVDVTGNMYASGNGSFGSTSSAGYRLYVVGNSRFLGTLDCTGTMYCQQINVAGTTYYGGGTYLSYFSDDRLKVKSNNIPEALSKISQLDGFYYTDSDTVTDLIRGTNSDGTVNLTEKETAQKVGVSADDLEKVLPEAVGKTLTEQSATETEYLTVDYAKIVPLLIEGIKELKTKVETLETKVAALEAD